MSQPEVQEDMDGKRHNMRLCQIGQVSKQHAVTVACSGSSSMRVWTVSSAAHHPHRPLTNQCMIRAGSSLCMFQGLVGTCAATGYMSNVVMYSKEGSEPTVPGHTLDLQVTRITCLSSLPLSSLFLSSLFLLAVPVHYPCPLSLLTIGKLSSV